MKQIIVFIVLLSSIAVVYMAKSATTVTGAKSVLKSQTAALEISYSPNTDIVTNDKILFTLGDAEAPDLNIPVSAQSPASPITGSVDLSTSGLYNIWIKTGQVAAIKQNIKQAVCEAAISATTISKTEATGVKVDTDATVKLTVPAKTLYNGDMIIYSISSGADPATDAADKKEVPLSNVDFAATTLSQTVKFTKAGTYNIWVKRDAALKQTDQTVVVASGSYIAMTMAFILGLLIL